MIDLRKVHKLPSFILDKISWRYGYSLSQEVEWAIDEFAKVEKDDGFQIDMSAYQEIDYGFDPKCRICFAGAALRGWTNREGCVEWGRDETYGPLAWTLDNIREGSISDAAFELMCKDTPLLLMSALDTSLYLMEIASVPVALYDEDPTQFKKDMRKIYKILVKLGL